ncbi:tetratricopeptide repeat protein [Sphingosinicella sp. BN140058]|uniref:tetratricopeptide repeat protein n=1 Tax=Sphingosinicella sp. BN140058 TaxID=1892855 RepID=UPI0010102BBD|nr:tetratricopeptide repeat protein [Sphingosinicella sp. BN140058]QAY75681.1 tetratricopeptide repeat protein [Sphingosinicella sp. BN140058]
MRFHLLAIALMAGVAMPAAAQQAERIDRRVDRLEQEMRAVQRRVFPGANAPYVGPEIAPATPTVEQHGVPAGTAVSDLTARVDALESQLATLTGQIEQNANRVRQLESAFNTLRDTTNARLEVLEQPAVQPAATNEDAPQASTRPAAPAATQAPAATSTADEAEAAYNAGYKLWEQKKFGEAQKTLEAVAKKWPKHRYASWAANLAGRAYLDDGKPAAAAKVFLANYQDNPKGERAADSLFFLGQSLVALGKPADACKAYDELQDVYGATIRDYLKQRLPQARSASKCK